MAKQTRQPLVTYFVLERLPTVMTAWRRWRVLTGAFIFFLLEHLYCEAFPIVGQNEVKVRQGENATLECYGPAGATDILLRWIKHDLKVYVIYFKDGHFQEHLQDHSFKGRVNLKDSEWVKNGNFSVILQNVTMNDTGRYECEAGYNNEPPRPLSSTSLKVEEAGHTGGQGGEKTGGGNSGSVGLIVGLSLPALLLVAAVFGFVIYRKYGNSNYQSPSEQGQEMSS